MSEAITDGKLVFSPGERVPKIVRILLANLFQSSRSTFSWGSFPSVFAFKEGMWDTHISALGVRQQYRNDFGHGSYRTFSGARGWRAIMWTLLPAPPQYRTNVQ